MGYRLDSDDLLNINTLKYCFDICEEKKLDFVFFDAIPIIETHKTTYIPTYDRKDKIETKIWNGTELLKYELNNGLFRPSACLCFVKHSFLDSFCYRFIPGIIHEDHSFIVQIHLNAQQIFYIDKPFYSRRIRENSIMTKTFGMKNIEGYTAGCIEIRDLIPNHPEWETIINLYLYDTLNAVIWAGHRMTFLEKMETFCRFHRLSLHKYVTLRNWAVFWLKRK